MLIDSHAHVGACHVFGAEQVGETLLKEMDRNGIDVSIVQPFPGAADVRGDHDAIARLAEKHRGRIRGLASVNPHLPNAQYVDEVTRCVEELHFVAVKLHTIGHAVAPGTPDSRLVFRTAAELGIPVMIHTGPGVPFAEPAAWIPQAREFSEVTVILAHAGAGLYTGPAIVAGETCDNVVLETSWCRPQDVAAAVNRLGPERVLFGSDMILNISTAVETHRVLDPDALTIVTSTAPISVFGL